MDRLASITAAFSAGKIPSQLQINHFIDYLTQSPIFLDDPTISAQLSTQGKLLQQDLFNVLVAYKQLGDNKNSDNKLQDALWHLTEADISSTSLSTDISSGTNNDQASKDAKAVAHSLRSILNILWDSFAYEGSALGHDSASFLRLALADLADYVSQSAGSTANSLRDLDAQIDSGDRNELGFKKRKAEDDAESDDVRVKFEKTMDTTKRVGSSAIGAGQAAAAKAQEISDKSSSRLQEAYNKMCDRALEDPEYHQSISTMFDLAQRWINKTLDSAGDVNQATDLEAFIDDPTPDKHLIQAIRGFRAVIESLAGGRSLDDLFAKLRICGVDIQQDPDLRAWFDELIAHLRKSLDEKDYAQSEEAATRRDKIKRDWKELLNADSDKGKKWKADVSAFRKEFAKFNDALNNDPDLVKLREAHAKLGTDLEDTLLAAAGQGTQTIMERAPWFFQDVFNFYLPRAMDMLKKIPIPRTEYKNDEFEFVLENLDISSLNLLPAHCYIRNITDIDITAPSPSTDSMDTSVGTLTRVFIQALQLQLREASFYYYDKTATMGPAEHTGLLEFTLPPQGIDIDIVVRTIPNSPEGLRQRRSKGSFTEIQRVSVTISEDVDLTVSQSNHSVLVSVFKPVMLSRFREALATTLEQQIHDALRWIDAVAWDVGRRTEVFEDTGLGRGMSVVAGMWSEIGHLSAGEGGLLSGWKATGTGVIKEDANAQFAMGAEPQVLSGEKHGPKGTFSEPLAESMDIDADGAVESAKDVAEQAKDSIKAGYEKVKSFKESVSAKVEEERSRPGWESSAFNTA